MIFFKVCFVQMFHVFSHPQVRSKWTAALLPIHKNTKPGVSVRSRRAPAVGRSSRPAAQLVLLFGGLFLLALAGFYFLHTKHPRANNSLLLVIAFSLLDLLSDALFAASLWNFPRLRTQARLALVFLILPAGLNFILAFATLWTEERRNKVGGRFLCAGCWRFPCVPFSILAVRVFLRFVCGCVCVFALCFPLCFFQKAVGADLECFFWCLFFVHMRSHLTKTGTFPFAHLRFSLICESDSVISLVMLNTHDADLPILTKVFVWVVGTVRACVLVLVPSEWSPELPNFCLSLRIL